MNKYALLMLAASCSWIVAEVAESTAETRVPLPVVLWPDATTIVDNDLLIVGDVQLQGGETSIIAENQDITVRMDGDFVIQGSDHCQSTLVICAYANRTVTFQVSKNLTFKGAAGNTQLPLLIKIVGEGTVIFSLHEGVDLDFTSDENSGGVEFYCVFQGSATPTCIFEHHDQEQLSFGPGCMMGYITIDDHIASVGKGIQFYSDHTDDRKIKIKYKHNSSIPLNVIVSCC